jgi:protein TonB
MTLDKSLMATNKPLIASYKPLMASNNQLMAFTKTLPPWLLIWPAKLLMLALALLVTLTLFIFMQRLIHNDGDNTEHVELVSFVELYKPPPSTEPEVETEPEPQELNAEPQMNSVAANVPDNQPQLNADIPSFDVGSLSIDTGPVGQGWTAPLINSDGLLDVGEDSMGYVEIVAFTTRRPNIPELAFKNKTNGWVLLVFNVARDGTTKNIRVLDANPRGVYEESAVSAVKHWRYSVANLKNYQGDMVLTQRLEMNWQDYKSNQYQ